MERRVFSNKPCRKLFCQTHELFCSCSGSCRGTYRQRILLPGQLLYGTRFIIRSLQPVGKLSMEAFQLPSAKTHIMLQPTAGVGRTKSKRKVESLKSCPSPILH